MITGNRDSNAQIEALLKITDMQVANLEAAGLLSDKQVILMQRLVDTVVSLHKAQSVTKPSDDAPVDWSEQGSK
jgi:hypothetical protein